MHQPKIRLVLFVVVIWLSKSNDTSALSTRLSFSRSRSQVGEQAAVSELANEIRQAYCKGGTDFVVDWALSHNILRCHSSTPNSTDTAKVLLQAALESSPDKSVVSGTISAFFGACYSLQYDNVHDTNTAALVLKLLESYEETTTMKPDLVALCLASSTLLVSECYRGEAKSVLQKADEIFSSNNKQNHAVKRMMTAEDKYVLERDFDIQVLMETEDCVVVSKPSGMVCYYEENKVIRKAAKDCLSLEDVLLQYLPLSTINKVGRGFVHRLDRGTSGCMVLAKTNQMHAQLVTQFFLRKAKKTYQALVTWKCQAELPLEGTVELDINGKPAKSLYRLECFRGENVAKIHVETLQGRKHQVRIHCSRALNAPILLDPRYGGEAIMFKIGKTSILPEMHAKKRFCLHAQALSIPAFDIDVQVVAPKWWQYVIDELEPTNKY